MKLTVLGAGCWGLTLTWLLTNNFEKVTVWGRDVDISDELRTKKSVKKPIEIQLQDKVEVTSDLENAVSDADIILLVVATSGIREVCKNLAKLNKEPDSRKHLKRARITLFDEDERGYERRTA